MTVVRMVRRGWKWIAAFLAFAVTATAFMLGMESRVPADDSAEAAMLRDMMVHHAQAVEMALMIRDRTEDEQLFFLATDIMLSQQHQIGMMAGWLSLWDLSPNQQGPMMAWMDQPIEDGPMPGMATAEQIRSLGTLPVAEAEIVFLQAMIRHHQGAVHMAEAYLDRGNQEEVAGFSRNIIAVQDREIQTMNALLKQRGAEPITDDLHQGH